MVGLKQSTRSLVMVFLTSLYYLWKTIFNLKSKFFFYYFELGVPCYTWITHTHTHTHIYIALGINICWKWFDLATLNGIRSSQHLRWLTWFFQKKCFKLMKIKQGITFLFIYNQAGFQTWQFHKWDNNLFSYLIFTIRISILYIHFYF
jgi:hypothetical protein